MLPYFHSSCCPRWLRSNGSMPVCYKCWRCDRTCHASNSIYRMFLELFVAFVAEKGSAEMDFDFVGKMTLWDLFNHDRVRARVLLSVPHGGCHEHQEIVGILEIVVNGMGRLVELVASGKSFGEVG